MAESNELQVLEKISTEVDEAQIKVILATQCIKAQAFLVKKLKKQVEHNKETCGYIGSANVKLQSEITQAEQEIKSFLIAKETIKMANVELNKELLLAKDKKLDLIERVERGEKKYEELWLECKARYESLPYVQKLLQAAQKAQNLKDQISALDKQADNLEKDIEERKVACLNTDRNRIIELAQFIVHERPKLLEQANEKSRAIADLMKEINNLDINTVAVTEVGEKQGDDTIDEMNKIAETNYNDNIDDYSLIMPNLQMDPLDIDELMSVNMDQENMNKVDYVEIELEKKESFSKSYFDITTSIFSRKTDLDESISSYFSKPSLLDEEKEQNYSRKKLINILEDVKVDANYAMDMISKVNPDTLQEVELISAEATTIVTKTVEEPEATDNLVQEPQQTEQVQEIEMISNAEDNDIVKPPTQFLDVSLKSPKSQETKKTVSFDLSIISPNDANNENINRTEAPEENIVNETINSPLDVSAVSDSGFDKIKDMVLKKHNLDLTPPFVYAKNTTLQKKGDDETVTSKFFKTNDNINDEPMQQENEIEKQPEISETITTNPVAGTSKIIELEDEVMVSSPKKQKLSTDEMCRPVKPFNEYQLFSHGPQGIPESLDISMSTTGYEDGDDFPHCIDSSLLLSPKADIQCIENVEVQSQEAPNFLSGLRKTGLSFFGRLGGGDSKPDSSATHQGNSGFSFNFGNDEKKNRGGLFSMFQ